MVGSRFALLTLALLVVLLGISCNQEESESGGKGMEIRDVEKTAERLREHVKYLTVTIGERSVGMPENLEKTAIYIESFYGDLELPYRRESYTYNDFTVATIVANIDFGVRPTKHYLLGAHYDSVWEAFLEEIAWGAIPAPSTYFIGSTKVQIEFTVLEGSMAFNVNAL